MKYIVLLLSLLAVATAQECPAASGQVINVGVLPVMNTLPIFVAEQKGFYEAAGITVNVIPIESARDRAIALQTGSIDIANNDVIAAALQVASGSPLKIIRHDAFAPGYRFFAIVTGAQSQLDDAAALTSALESGSAQIAISNNTVIEYLSTQLLRQQGYEPQANTYIEISAIPVRAEQLAQGTVAAAMIPEPLVTLASSIQGGTVVLDDSQLDFVPVALTATGVFTETRAGDLCRYLQAYDQATAAINADPEAYRQNAIRIPEPVQGSYTVPRFVEARVPSPSEIEQVLDWMLERGLLDSAIAYEDLVDSQFLRD